MPYSIRKPYIAVLILDPKSSAYKGRLALPSTSTYLFHVTTAQHYSNRLRSSACQSCSNHTADILMVYPMAQRRLWAQPMLAGGVGWFYKKNVWERELLVVKF